MGQTTGGMYRLWNRGLMYKEVCNLCKGNGYIKIDTPQGNDQIKQCWLCESEGEHRYSQAEVDKFIYETYYKHGKEKTTRKG